MDAFVKTRRSRLGPGPGGDSGQRKPRLALKTQSAVCCINGLEDESASSAYTVQTPLDVKLAARSSVGGASSGYEGDNSSQGDRQSMCSSPLSDSSYFSSDVPDDYSVYCDRRYNRDKGVSLLRSRNPSPLFLLGSDIMAQVLTFLDASEILSVLTMPLCKDWHRSYGAHQDLWKTMCLLEPFKATLVDNSDSDSEDSFASLPVEPSVKNVFGEYRLMFTSFVRCLRYLERIQQDARNGRPPSASDNSLSGFPHFGISKGLKRFLQRKKDVFGNNVNMPVAPAAPIQTNAVGVTDSGYRKRSAPSVDECTNKKPKYGNSMITSRLLGPSSKGEPSHLHLPRSCAIYSIVNWMVAYPNVEGIQVRCVETLPVLLEDESQRLLAQRVGLIEVVLRAMLCFPNCPKLHIAAFHALVLLARPLGGREGMLFDNSMAESSTNAATEMMSYSPIHRNAAPLDRNTPARLNGVSGINIMLDSMRRFQDKSDLQAMACWAFVNLALVPAQKAMILNLGGIEVALNAMRRHPADADVQFRALFALINLVVAPQAATNTILDAHVDQITLLVVRAMTNFCSSGAVLNRACLVLHNLAQRHDYLAVLLWTPHCYQMIEWCLANYPTDSVLRRATTSILHRLQVLLASDERLRDRFVASLRSQEELTLSRVVAGEQL